jgi:hypothetical protein
VNGTPQVIQHTTIPCPTVDSGPITRYCFSMNTTIPLAMLSPDDVKRIMTDDEVLSDADPVADRAAFVAYLRADEDEDTAFANALAAVAHNMTVRWITDLNRRVAR